MTVNGTLLSSLSNTSEQVCLGWASPKQENWCLQTGIPLLDDYANLQTYICVALHENVR